jgi:hypothetical protein
MDLKPLGCTLSGGLIWFSPVVNRILRLTIPFLVAGALVGVIFWLYDDTTALQLEVFYIVLCSPCRKRVSYLPVLHWGSISGHVPLNCHG